MPSVVLKAVAAGKDNYGYSDANDEYGDYGRVRHPGPDQGHAHGAAERRLIRPLRGYEALRANAGLMITTDAMVAEAPRKEAGGGDHAHGGGMGGMDFQVMSPAAGPGGW